MELVAGAHATILVFDAGKDDQPRGPKGCDGSGRGVFRDADARGQITDAQGRRPALVGEVRAEREVFKSDPSERPQPASPGSARRFGDECRCGRQDDLLNARRVLGVVFRLHVAPTRSATAMRPPAASLQ